MGIWIETGWINFINQFSNVYIASPVKNLKFFLNGHDSHFDYRALRYMDLQNIKSFVLKAGDPTNDQPNDNVPNSKLKSLYNEAKATWMLKYKMTKFLSYHMNFVLV